MSKDGESSEKELLNRDVIDNEDSKVVLNESAIGAEDLRPELKLENLVRNLTVVDSEDAKKELAVLNQNVIGNKDVKHIAPLEAPIDITEEFFAECSKLKLGELAIFEDFHLSEAMAAIELMDPKMDIGMVPLDSSTSFESLVASGRLNVVDMDPREVIATMDAMFTSLMSWVEGNSLVQTLLTCVCLHDPGGIKDPVLSSFCYAILDLITKFTHIVQTAAVYEEEDFDTYCFELNTKSPSCVLVALKSAETSLQKKIKKGKDVDGLTAILFRISFLRHFIAALSALHISSNVRQDRPFQPNLEEAAKHIRVASDLAEKMITTTPNGLQPDDSHDGNFAWLPAFEPDVNRRHLPPTFPRKVNIASRVDGLRELARLCARIQSITTDLPACVETVESVLGLLRSFSAQKSCVVSRSLLQLVVLPTDDHVMGRTPLQTLVVDSICLFAAPPIVDPTCPLSSDARACASWDEFVRDTVKVFLGIIQVFGQNLSRQREKIVYCIEDLSALREKAERAEIDFDNFFRGGKASVGLSLTFFVIYHTLLLIEYHFCLSFKLDLFAAYEYPYVYWYMSDVIYKWLLNTVDRSLNLISSDYLRSLKERKKGDRRRPVMSQREVLLTKRISLDQRCLSFYKAQALLAHALFKTSVGLMATGKIRNPPGEEICERLRFENRIEPFASLAPPFVVGYEEFVQSSGLDQLRSQGSETCFTQAAKAFDAARSQLEKFAEVEAIDEEGQTLIRICKHNAVVSRIFASGNKADSKVDVSFDESSLMFPLFKIV